MPYNCYVWRGSYGSNTYTLQACASNPGWVAVPEYPGYFAPSENGQSLYTGWVSSATSITLVTSESARAAAVSGTIFAGGDCSSCINNPSTVNYDCLNGVCTPASMYKTPGLYESLDNCKAVCANGGACASGRQCVDPTTFCPDGKVCIDQGEFTSIEALISKIGSEVC